LHWGKQLNTAFISAILDELRISLSEFGSGKQADVVYSSSQVANPVDL
jgi:hypothetical protein